MRTCIPSCIKVAAASSNSFIPSCVEIAATYLSSSILSRIKVADACGLLLYCIVLTSTLIEIAAASSSFCIPSCIKIAAACSNFCISSCIKIAAACPSFFFYSFSCINITTAWSSSCVPSRIRIVTACSSSRSYVLLFPLYSLSRQPQGEVSKVLRFLFFPFLLTVVAEYSCSFFSSLQPLRSQPH